MDDEAALRRRRKTFLRWFGIVWLIALLILPAYWFRDEILGRSELGPEHIGVQREADAEPAPDIGPTAAPATPVKRADGAATATDRQPATQTKPGAAALLAAEGSLAGQAKSLGQPRKTLTAADRKLAGKLERAIDGGVGVTHLVVNDAQTGETIFNYQDGAVTPASLLKVMTSLYALEALGPEHRFSTTTTLTGADTLDGAAPLLTVTLVGDGDANLDDAAIEALAADTARALAEELDERDLVAAPRLQLRIDDSAFSGDGRNSNWNPQIYAGGNMTTIRPAAMYGGRERPGTKSERTDRDPNHIVAERFHRALNKRLTGDQSPVRLQALPAGEQLVAKSPKGATELARHRSQPLAEYLKPALLHSDNQLIETTMRAALVSQGLRADQATVARELQRYVRGYATDESAEQVQLADASGLAAVQNTVPPSVLARALTAVQHAAADPANPRHDVAAALLAGLPEPGASGTLADRFTGAEAKGKLRAKTGSLLHAATLAGVVDGAEGGYVFSITIDNALGHAPAARDKVDRIIEQLW